MRRGTVQFNEETRGSVWNRRAERIMQREGQGTGANDARHRCEPVRQRRWLPDTAEAREKGVEVTKDGAQITSGVSSTHEPSRMMHIAECPNDRNATRASCTHEHGNKGTVPDIWEHALIASSKSLPCRSQDGCFASVNDSMAGTPRKTAQLWWPI